MRKKITIFQYIANQRPNDAYLLLQKYGSGKGGNYNRARSEQELVSQLKQFVRENGNMGLMALASIHPDKELIEQFIAENNMSNSVVGDSISSKDAKYSNATGGDGTPNLTNEQKETISFSKMMIYGSFLLIGLALVIRKN